MAAISKSGGDVDYFLEINQAPGESKDLQYPNTIHVSSWKWGERNSGDFGINGAGGSGKVSVDDLEVRFLASAATAPLISLCTTGKHFPTARLICRKNGASEPLTFLTIELSKCLISSYRIGGNTSMSHSNGNEVSGLEEVQSRPVEVVTINFQEFHIEYTPQNGDGGLAGGPKVFKYNRATNSVG
ncbi:type VI secretion system tube protein Hcp [Rahnella sp. SAP-1]|jgi:type VI secretion system secreted protein Hcp|uniref:Type VI secretion system tube protein Hcp n=1 Tax=Rouxiella aceris TaxID=2703884 RepID=A0A848MEU6_9GAMM|nr:type VI secretion system tube protein Hcp [Rouxiella aceris]NMP25711.1 type VI secretion system tube protein Hcp [Rouxiella aceris]